MNDFPPPRMLSAITGVAGGCKKRILVPNGHEPLAFDRSLVICWRPCRCGDITLPHWAQWPTMRRLACILATWGLFATCPDAKRQHFGTRNGIRRKILQDRSPPALEPPLWISGGKRVIGYPRGLASLLVSSSCVPIVADTLAVSKSKADRYRPRFPKMPVAYQIPFEPRRMSYPKTGCAVLTDPQCPDD